MADTRTILEHYSITETFPEAWPASNDAEDASDDESVQRPQTLTQNPNRYDKAKSRYSVLELTGGRSVRAGSVVSKDKVHSVIQDDEEDPLGARTTIVQALKRQGLPVEDDQRLRNRFLLSSTTFNPSAYLSQVHARSSTQDLVKGLDFLSRSIEQKSASLKVLVESNFERFVRAKTTIDSVYTEMRNQGNDGSETQRRPHSRHASRTSTHYRSVSGQSISAKSPVVDKKKHALVKESEYGLLGIRAPLMEVAVNAEDIWGPALGGRDREENLKTVLDSFQKAQGVFQVGGQIATAIRHKDYESLIKHYSKAKQYADDAREIADASTRTNMALSDSEVHQLVITARMWLNVEEQIKDFKRDIWRELTSIQANLAMATDKTRQNDHMTLIGILLELGVDDNPIWLWLLSRYDYVRDRINATFARSRMEIEALRRRLAIAEKPGIQAAAVHFQSPSKHSGDDLVRNFDSAQVLEMWEMILHCMTRLLSVQGGVLGELLDFWEKAQSFINGSAQKGLPAGIDGGSAKHHRLSSDGVRDLQNGVGELVDLLRDSLFAFFAEPPIEDISGLMALMMGVDSPKDIPKSPLSAALLSPLSAVEPHFKFDGFGLPPSPTKVGTQDEYAFWPPNANSLSSVHYLSELLKLVGTAAAEMATIRPSPVYQPSEKLKVMLNMARERCARAVITAWKSDAEMCKVLEDWTRGSDRSVTQMPSRFDSFERYVLSGLQKMLYLPGAASGRASTAEVIVPPPGKLTALVRSAFTTGLFATLSGIVENAEHPIHGSQDLWAADGGVTQVQTGVTGLGDSIDVNNKNLRLVLTFSNLKSLQAKIVPSLVTQFETDFSVKLTQETQSISDTLAKIERTLFTKYTRPIVERLTSTIQTGVSSPTWVPTTSRPTQVAAYVYDALLQLVYVHTEVSNATPALCPQILSFLLEQVSRALLDAFRHRSRYPLPALMQATLDVEFIAQTLGQYSTEAASATQSEIYLLLDQGTDAGARARLQSELGEMRAALKRLREATKSEFACFKKEKRGGK